MGRPTLNEAQFKRENVRVMYAQIEDLYDEFNFSNISSKKKSIAYEIIRLLKDLDVSYLGRYHIDMLQNMKQHLERYIRTQMDDFLHISRRMGVWTEYHDANFGDLIRGLRGLGNYASEYFERRKRILEIIQGVA